MPMRRLNYWLVFVLLSLPVAAVAGGGPYKDLYQPIAKIKALDKDGLLQMHYRIKPKDPGVALPQVELKLVVDGAETAIPLDADGGFELPLRADWAEHDAQFVTNQPKGS